MAKRIIIRLSDEKEKMLEDLMREDNVLDEPVAPYIARLISSETKRRDEIKSKRPVGRPKKEGDGDFDGHDDPDWEGSVYRHPDEMMNADRLCTRTEMEGWYNLKGLPVPANPKRVDGK